MTEQDRIRSRLTTAAGECAIKLLFDHRVPIRNTGRANPDTMRPRIELARDDLPMALREYAPEEVWRGEVMARINAMAEEMNRPWRGNVNGTRPQ